MIRIEDGIEVAAPAERAFAVVTRIEEFPDWLPGVQRAELVGGPASAGGLGDPAPAMEGSAAVDGGPAVEGSAAVDGGPAPLRAGTEFHLVSSGPGGIVVTALGKVDAIDPPRSIGISAASGLFRLAATCTVEALGPERSRVAVVAEIEPLGLARFAAGRIEQELRAAAPDALGRLRAAAEG